MDTAKRSIRNPLHLSRGLFLSLYGSAAMLFPFLAVYFEARGLSGREIGLLVAILPAVSIVAGPLWGAAADAAGGHKRLMILALGASVLLALPLPLAAGLPGAAALLILHAAFFTALPAFVDHTAMEALEGRSGNYGQLRLWGSIGWGLSGLLLAPMLTRFGLTWIFFGHAAALVIGLVAALGLPSGSRTTRESQPPSQPRSRPKKNVAMRSITSSLRTLLADRRWQAFLLLILTAGFGSAIVNHFQFLYLNSLSASAALMSLTLSLGVLSELAMLALSDRLLQSYGATRLLVLGTALQAVQLLAWSFIRDPQLAIVTYLLKGIAFGALWTAAVAYARQIAPPGLATTALGILSSAFFGLASAAGALIGGLGYELAGPAGLFLWTGLGMLVALLAYSMAGRRRRRVPQSSEAAESLPC